MTDGLTTDTALQDPAARLGRLDAADVAIAVPACGTFEDVHTAVEAARQVVRAVIPDRRLVLAYPESVAGDPSGEMGGRDVQVIPWSLPAATRPSPTATGRTWPPEYDVPHNTMRSGSMPSMSRAAAMAAR